MSANEGGAEPASRGVGGVPSWPSIVGSTVADPAQVQRCPDGGDCGKENRTSGDYLSMGLWCSGITSALHAEGPGLNPQWVHVPLLSQVSKLLSRLVAAGPFPTSAPAMA